MSKVTDPEPGPLDSCGPDIADLVCEDIQARKGIGIRAYGMPLRDAYAEILDMAHYVRQELAEREALVERLHAMADEMDRYQEGFKYSAGIGLRMAACLVSDNHPKECR